MQQQKQFVVDRGSFTAKETYQLSFDIFIEVDNQPVSGTGNLPQIQQKNTPTHIYLEIHTEPVQGSTTPAFTRLFLRALGAGHVSFLGH